MVETLSLSIGVHFRGSTVNNIPYRQIRLHLQSPRRIIVDPLRRDCNPPEDPNWPTPRALEEVEELMKRLPHWAQVACAITAAEMVFPIWEEWAEGIEDLSIEHREAPWRAIETAWQWLEEETSETQEADVARRVARRADAAYAAADAAIPAGAPSWAARATGDAAHAAARFATVWGARSAWSDPAWAAHDAATAWWAINDDAPVNFYNDWWRLCRCRLAFILEVRISPGPL